MSVEAEAQALLRELAEPAVPGELVTAAVGRAARRAGLSASRVGKIWYGNARAILAVEMDQLRERAATAREAKNVEIRNRDSALVKRMDAYDLELAQLRRELAEERGGMASAPVARPSGSYGASIGRAVTDGAGLPRQGEEDGAVDI